MLDLDGADGCLCSLLCISIKTLLSCVTKKAACQNGFEHKGKPFALYGSLKGDCGKGEVAAIGHKS